MQAVDVILQGAKIPVDSKAEENGWTALHIAVSQNNETLSKYLLEHGANVNAKGMSFFGITF